MILAGAKYLWWLIALAGIFLLEFFLFKRKERRMEELFSKELKGLIFKNWSKKNYFIKTSLFFAALFFIVLALSQPQWGKKIETTGLSGMDIFIALDTSSSMLADDLAPNRLENAKAALALILDQLAGNRVGLVAFSGSAFIQCPLTTDTDAIKLFLNAVDTTLIPNPGTNIGEAINTCVKGFGKSNNSKAIILITDGEELDGSAQAGADYAAKESIRIYAVGIGSVDGATVPVLDKEGKKSGTKKDRKGEVVISRANPELLNLLAQKTKGLSFMISSDQAGFQKLFWAVSSLPKQNIKAVSAYHYEERFQIFIFLAIVCLAAELLITERKNDK